MPEPGKIRPALARVTAGRSEDRCHGMDVSSSRAGAAVRHHPMTREIGRLAARAAASVLALDRER
jgi:hypothetical protein